MIFVQTGAYQHVCSFLPPFFDFGCGVGEVGTTRGFEGGELDIQHLINSLSLLAAEATEKSERASTFFFYYDGPNIINPT